MFAVARHFADRALMSLHTDARAAMRSLRDIGRVRHTDVQDLRLQENTRQGHLRTVKLSGLLTPPTF